MRNINGGNRYDSFHEKFGVKITSDSSDFSECFSFSPELIKIKVVCAKKYPNSQKSIFTIKNTFLNQEKFDSIPRLLLSKKSGYSIG